MLRPMIEVNLVTGFVTPNMSKKVTLIRRAELLAIPAVGTILTDTDYNVIVRSLRFHRSNSLFVDCFEHVIGSDFASKATNNEELDVAVAAYEHKGWKRISSEPEPAKLTVEVAMNRLKEEIQKNSDYTWTWYRNIAMSIRDEGVEAATANLAATRFMATAFDVDITKSETVEYREPTEADVGKIIECCDSSDVDNGTWFKRRLIKINKDSNFPFIGIHATDTVEEVFASGRYRGWTYARIEAEYRENGSIRVNYPDPKEVLAANR